MFCSKLKHCQNYVNIMMYLIMELEHCSVLFCYIERNILQKYIVIRCNAINSFCSGHRFYILAQLMQSSKAKKQLMFQSCQALFFFFFFYSRIRFFKFDFHLLLIEKKKIDHNYIKTKIHKKLMSFWGVTRLNINRYWYGFKGCDWPLKVFVQSLIPNFFFKHIENLVPKVESYLEGFVCEIVSAKLV